MPRNKYAGMDEYEIELEKAAQAHAEVEWYNYKLSHKTTSANVAKKIEAFYGEDMLAKICERNIKPLLKNTEYKDITTQDLVEKIKTRELSQLIPAEEVIGGLVWQVDYPETREFLRKSQLFKTISDMFKKEED